MPAWGLAYFSSCPKWEGQRVLEAEQVNCPHMCGLEWHVCQVRLHALEGPTLVNKPTTSAEVSLRVPMLPADS